MKHCTARPFPFRQRSTRATLALLVLLTGLQGAQAQSPTPSFCASDGQPQPVQLLERFINADCASCWQDRATPQPVARSATLDWVLPGRQGDDAPLSNVASRDGLARLEALGQSAPASSAAITHRVRGLRGARLRVAHGLPLSGYMGASVALQPIQPLQHHPAAAPQQRPILPGWTAWLALAEHLPAGTEGSPVARNLVRNVFQSAWNGPYLLSIKEQQSFKESRVMSIAPDVNPDRLSVIGWVEDAQGRVVVAAQSRCL